MIKNNTIYGNLDFQQFVAIAMVCDKGDTLPASPVEGQWFLHIVADVATLKMYKNSAWEDFAGGSGDVTGPASAGDDNVAVFDGITGKVIKDSAISIYSLVTGDQVAQIESDAIWIADDVGTPNATDKIPIIQDGEPYLLKSITWEEFIAILDAAYAVASHAHDAADILLSRTGSTVVHDLQTMQNVVHSTGWVSGGVVTDNGDGTINVTAGVGLIRAEDDSLDELKFCDWPADTNVALTNNVQNWVMITYSDGAPHVQIFTTEPTNSNSQFVLATVYRRNTELHLNTAVRQTVGDHARLMMLAMEETMPFANASGGIISDAGSRQFDISAGAWWNGLTRFTTPLFDGSATNFNYYYRNGSGGWTEVSAATVINNTQYDDGSGVLATLSAASRYGVHWIYLGVDGDVHAVYGQGNYTLSGAQDAQPLSSIPPELETDSRLIGKIIIQKSAVIFTSVESAIMTVFNLAPVTDHNTLSGLQGGTAAEYYHLTSAQQTDLTDAGDSALHYHSADRVESNLTLTDITTNDVTTTKHGFAQKAVAPAATFLNALAILNGETTPTWRVLMDATLPANVGTAAAGTAAVFARRDHVHAATESSITTTDVTTGNASTTKHGFLLKAVAPISGLMNFVGITSGETIYSNKPLFDSTNPAALGSAGPGTQLIAARRDHIHANPAIDTLAAATDITTLNATTTVHGLLIKATAPAVASLIKVVGIANGETVYSLKNAREILTAARTYYVRTDGSDSNSGLVDSAGGGFLTIQKAIDVIVSTLDTAGYTVTIQVRTGTYTGAVSVAASWTGGGAIILQGDTTTPSNVYLNVTGTCLSISAPLPARFTFQGFKLAGTVFAINITSACAFDYGAIEFAASGTHIQANVPGVMMTCISNYSITGGAVNHWVLQRGAACLVNTRTITLTGTPAFTTFAAITMLSVMRLATVTFTGAASAGTKKYVSEINAAIYTTGGVTIPGGVAGTTATGGQYI